MPAPAISVCVVASRKPALEDCLLSLLAQKDPPEFELLVSIAGDPDIAAAVRRAFPDARLCHRSGLSPGAARNDLVARAAGELLLFVDDDVITDPRLMRRLVELADEHPEASVFGGPNETPSASTRFQYVQGAVLASLVGSGPVRRRYGAHPAGAADERWFILCNLAVRRSAMVPFPEDIVCAEENAVLADLHDAGILMHYSPDLIVFHERRATPRSFASQMFKYGRGRGELARSSPRATRIAYVAPSVLLVYLLALPALTVYAGTLSLLGAGLYAAVVAASATHIGWTLRRASAAPAAVWLVIVLHVCYGAGVLRGAAVGPRARERPASHWEEDGTAIPALTHERR